MKAKNLLARALSGLGALLAVAIAGLFAEPAVFDEEAEEETTQPEEAADTEPAGGGMIDTSSWDELSKQVLPKVIESNLDFGTLLRYAQKASCTVYMVVKTPQIAMPELGSFTVPQGPPSTARISLSWEDANDDGTIAEDEVKIETRYTSDIAVKMAMERVHKGLKNLVTLSVVNLLTQSTVKAERKSQGYEITVNPKKGPPVPVRLTVSGDFRITSTQTRAMDGSDVVNNLKHTRTGGKWLVTGAETTSGAGTDFTSTDKLVNEYQIQDGIPLLAKATIASTSSTGGGVLQTHQEYSFRDWQIQKRDEPLEVAAEPTGVEEPRVEPTRVQKTRAKTPKTVAGPEKRVAAPRVRILRTEQAKKLANDTIVSVGSAYYDIAAAGVKAYDASFTVELDGEPVGSFKLKWEAFMGVSVQPDLADDEAKRFVEALGQQIGRVFSGGPLSDYSFAADAYAAKSANQTVIDATAHASATDPNVRSDLVYVSPDLRQVRTVRTMGSGETSERVYAGEEVEGKLFVSSATQTTKESGGTPEKTEYTWTYSRREGVPFVKRLEWSGAVGEQTGDWKVLLENVTFEREVARIKVDAGPEEAAKLARKVKVPHTEEANKLAREVLTSARKKFYTLQSRGVSGFTASYAMEFRGDPVGTLKATWNRGDGEVRAKLEGAPPDTVNEEAVEGRARWELGTILGWIWPAAGSGAYAMKSGNEYIVDFTEQERKRDSDLETAIAYIPHDFTEYRDVYVRKGGVVEEWSYRGGPGQGGFLPRSFTWTVVRPGVKRLRDVITLSHTEREGVFFIGRADLHETFGDSECRLTAVLKDVAFEKGAVPTEEAESPDQPREVAGIPGALTGLAPAGTQGPEPGPVPSAEELMKLAEEAKVPRSQEAKKLAEEVIERLRSYYDVIKDSVGGFDATYGLQKDGRPVGKLKVTWGIMEALVPSAKLVGEAPDDVRKAAEDLGREGLDVVLGIPCDPGLMAGGAVYAVKSGGQLILDGLGAVREQREDMARVTKEARKQRELKSYFVFVSEGTTTVRILESYADGGTLVTAVEAAKSEGKYLINSMVTSVREPGQEPLKREYQYTHAKMQMGRREGAAPPKSYTFVKEVTVKEARGAATATWTATLERVSCTEFRME